MVLDSKIYFNLIEDFLMNKQIKDYPEQIQDKLIYMLKDGKRIRPILSLIFTASDTECNKLNDIKKNIIYKIISLIEIIHCLSLVLDDLPEMDNDLIRRGKECFHIKYGVNYTNFFIYYIFNRISLSLDILLKEDINNFNIDAAYDLHSIFKYNLNMLIDGQYIDLEWDKFQNSINPIYQSNNFSAEKKIIIDLIDIHDYIYLLGKDDGISRIMKNIDLNMKKTSSLFNLSVCSGYLLQIWWKEIDYTKTNTNDIFNKLIIWSNILGYFFQISDDILDYDEDILKNKPNICSIIGKIISIKLLSKGCEWLHNMSNVLYENMQQFDEDKKTSFDIYVVNQIIKKIENRIKQSYV